MHLDILDNNRQKLLQKLIPLLEGFTLGGGTALALQLNHRKSFDFDFFSSSPLPKRLLERLSHEFSIQNIVVDTTDELTFFTKEGIKITFLYYPFKPYFEIQKTKDGLHFFPVQEIALQKAYTIGRRGEYRDYFDLYTILNNGYIKLEEIISKTKTIYGGAFDEKMFLQQLVYLGDISNFEIIPASDIPLSAPENIKQYFEKLVQNFL